jgi:hypothetical protein
MDSDYDDADRFRRQAGACWEEAAKAGNPVDEASWQRLADDFDQRAQQLHRALERRLSKLEPS